MRLFRFLFGVIAIVAFFLLGMGFADKEYLSENVVGIRIYTDDSQNVSRLYELLGQIQCTSAEELCKILCAEEVFAYICPEKQYFSINSCSFGHFPYAAYDTIIIKESESSQIEVSYLKQLCTVPQRFGCVQGSFESTIQKYYISFLSYLGKVEKFISTTCLDSSR